MIHIHKLLLKDTLCDLCAFVVNIIVSVKMKRIVLVTFILIQRGLSGCHGILKNFLVPTLLRGNA